MTCIIATTRYICAERRVTEDGGAASSMIKVARNPWLIAAAAGNAACTLAVKQAVRAGACEAADLLGVVDAGSYVLALSCFGVLSLISEGVVWAVPDRVTAIGSGADLALGFMAGAESVSADTARRAQKFVAKRRVDCGGGCDIRIL